MKTKKVLLCVVGAMCVCLIVSCQTRRIIDFDSLNRKLLLQIENKESSDETLLQSISRLGKHSEPPAFWIKIANDDTYSIKHRSRCIMALFRRHAQQCTGVHQLAGVLAPVSWLRSNDVDTIDVLAGSVPVSPGADRTVFVIKVLAGSNFAIYISVLGKMDRMDFYRAFCDAGQKNNAVVLEYGYADDYDQWLSERQSLNRTSQP